MNRLAIEYQNTIARATGERIRQSGESAPAAITNATDEIATKSVAAGREIRPRGISRIAVRGLAASKSASTRRLNPIAALRAATIATTIQITEPHENGTRRAASSAPVSANGSAKTEWLKRMNDRYLRTDIVGCRCRLRIVHVRHCGTAARA